MLQDRFQCIFGTGTPFARGEDRITKNNSNAEICKKAVDHEFVNTGGISEESHGGQQIQQISELHPNTQSLMVWKTRFKTQVTTCSDFPSDAMLWIKEVEMVDSLDELKSSRSVSGNNFPNFEMLDAKIASV